MKKPKLDYQTKYVIRDTRTGEYRTSALSKWDKQALWEDGFSNARLFVSIGAAKNSLRYLRKQAGEYYKILPVICYLEDMSWEKK
jgi:hypothetical protein